MPQKKGALPAPFDVPTKENRALGDEIARLERQQREEADSKLSATDRLKAAYEAAKTLGSGALGAISSIPTYAVYGPDAAEKHMANWLSIPESEKGMEYVENVADFLDKLETKYKIPPILPQVYGTEALMGAAARQGKAAAKQGIISAAKKAEKVAERQVPKIMEQGGAKAQLLQALGSGTASNVVKPEGGNWLKGAVKRGVSGLKVHERTPGINGHTEADQAVDVALNKWIDSNLANYLQKQMGTPSDPIRKLADEGIIHMTDIDTYGVGTPTYTGKVRREAGFPESGMAETQMGKRWENASDSGIASIRAGDIQAIPALEAKAEESNRLYSEASAKMRAGLRKRLEDRGMSEQEIEAFSRMRDSDIAQIMGDDTLLRLRDEASTDAARVDTTNKVIASENPWISKLDPEEKVYYGGVYDLGFDHVMDVLREDLATGRIRPEQLNKVSVEQAVRRTHEYNKEMAAKAAAAKAAAREGLPVYKEYPEGFRWVELNKPGSFASESESMGHSVRGYEPPKGHPDWIEGSGDSGSSGYGHGGWESIKSGKAKVYSLVDPKGEPHVTVEVGPNDHLDFNSWFEKQPKELRDEINARARRGEHNMSIFEAPEYLAAREALPPRITQIKGKVNRAPKDEYLPFVQDFVKGSEWSDVGDMSNTGLRDVKRWINPETMEEYKKYNLDVPKYATDEELDALHSQYERLANPDGMAKGGRVQISGNPDTMKMELAGGGLVKGLAKAAKASAEADKIIQAPSIIVPGKLSELKEAIRQSSGDYGARRIERAADEIPNLEKLYQEKALREAFSGDNAKAVMTMNPKDFEKYSLPLDARFMDESSTRYTTSGDRLSYPDYMTNYLPNVGAFSDVPFLEINKKMQGTKTPPFISGHEGRHRSRVLTDKGEQAGLVRLLPRAELREPFPRRSQEEYIEALKKELELSGKMVRPETYFDNFTQKEIKRNAVKLPDVYAEGGEVHKAGGGAIKALAKTAKAAKEAAVPLEIPRVRPSLKDILQAAERVGKQQAGEHVTNPLVGPQNLAGRSVKEAKRLKDVEYKLTPLKQLEKVDKYKPEIGDVYMAVPGDQTVSDAILESIGDMSIGSIQEGGAKFGHGRLADPEEVRAFWASNEGPAQIAQNKAGALADLYGTDRITAQHLAMGPISNHFAQHFADANMRAIDYSKMNKSQMNLFDNVIAGGYKDSVSGKQITFPEWPGIANPQESLEMMKNDPLLRKWFNNRMKTEKLTSATNMPNGKTIEWAITEPEIRNMEVNLTGLSTGRLKPGASLIPESSHNTYSHDIPGTFSGQAEELAPFAISFPDVTDYVRNKYRPQDFTGTIQKVFPHQVVDEAYLEDMDKYYRQLRKVRGFAKGGKIKKANGGEITTKDIKIEERRL